MIRHCVMFRWSADLSADVKAEIATRLDRLAALDGVVAYRHGADLGLRDGNWDYVVVGDFADEAAYQRYATDADHVDLVTSLVAPNITDRAAVQYDIPGST